MNKILVTVYVPAVMRTFEVYIPVRSKLYEIKQLMEKAILEITDGSFQPNANNIICARETGIIYNINLTVEQIGLKNGSQLMIV